MSDRRLRVTELDPHLAGRTMSSQRSSHTRPEWLTLLYPHAAMRRSRPAIANTLCNQVMHSHLPWRSQVPILSSPAKEEALGSSCGIGSPVHGRRSQIRHNDAAAINPPTCGGAAARCSQLAGVQLDEHHPRLLCHDQALNAHTGQQRSANSRHRFVWIWTGDAICRGQLYLRNRCAAVHQRGRPLQY